MLKQQEELLKQQEDTRRKEEKEEERGLWRALEEAYVGDVQVTYGRRLRRHVFQPSHLCMQCIAQRGRSCEHASLVVIPFGW